MKRATSIIETIIGFGGTLALVITAWVNMNARVSVLETDNKNSKEQMTEIKGKLEKIQQNTTDILIQLQNKQDRQ